MDGIQTLPRDNPVSATSLRKGYVMSAAMSSLWRRVRKHGIASPEVAESLAIWGELYEQAD